MNEMGATTRSARLCILFLMAASVANGFSISVITITPSIRSRGKFLAKNDAFNILRATGSLADTTISLLEDVTKGSLKISAQAGSPPLPAGCSVSVQNLLGLVQLNGPAPTSSTGLVSPMAVVIRTVVDGAQAHIIFDIKDASLPGFRKNVNSICPPAAPQKKKPKPAKPAPPTTVTAKFSAGLSAKGGGSESKVQTDGDFTVQTNGSSQSKAFGTTSASTNSDQGLLSASSATDTVASRNAAQGSQTIALNAQGIGLGQGTATSLVTTQLGAPVLGRKSLPATASSNSNFVVFGTPFAVSGLLTDTAQSGTFPQATMPPIG